MTTVANPGGSTPSGPLDRPRPRLGGKSIWDWLDLISKLAIPIVVVGVTIGFGWWQVHLADVQHQQDQLRVLDQQEATTLQTYIDNIQGLLLNHNLLKSKPNDDVAILARARTLTALEGLDPHRKGILLKFLYEAKLIGSAYPSPLGSGSIKSDPIFRLSQADLTGAYLNGAFLFGADLTGAYLNGADLTGARLSFANLSGAVRREVASVIVP